MLVRALITSGRFEEFGPSRSYPDREELIFILIEGEKDSVHKHLPYLSLLAKDHRLIPQGSGVVEGVRATMDAYLNRLNSAPAASDGG